MTERVFFDWIIVGWFILAAIVFAALFFIVAPYGRHTRNDWGLTINSRVSWIVMEAASPIIFAIYFGLGRYTDTVAVWVFLVLWEAHYIHRAFIYPFSLHHESKRMPFIIITSGIIFNGVNAYLNGRWIYTF